MLASAVIVQSGGVVRMGGTWSVLPGAWRCPRGACGARVQRTSVVTTVLKCAEVKKLDRNACVAELSKLHVHLPVKLPNDNSEVSCTVTMH